MLSPMRIKPAVSNAVLSVVALLQWSSVGLAQKSIPGNPPPGAPIVAPRTPEISPNVRIISEPGQAPTPVLTALNFGFTANAVTPFSVALNWDAVANAATYTIFRDGVALAQVPGTSRSFQDNSVAPASRHRYSIQARCLSLA